MLGHHPKSSHRGETRTAGSVDSHPLMRTELLPNLGIPGRIKLPEKLMSAKGGQIIDRLT